MGLCAYLAIFVACEPPASVTAMIPTSFETARKHSQSVRVSVTGGHDGRDRIGRI
jgi:hypothetical protein